MARDPALTFRGALKILGKDEPRWLKALDSVLGGAILSTGLLDPIPQVWGWVDQKNEAMRWLREGVGWVTGRIVDTGGLRRHELVVAAHTTIVLTAFFDAVRDTLGPRFDRADMSDHEKLVVIDGSFHRPLVHSLYDAPVPAPSATSGHNATTADIHAWAFSATADLGYFLDGLAMDLDWSNLSSTLVADLTVANYRALHLQLQTDVPEFAIWADNTAHAATQHALEHLERLLTRGPNTPPRDAQATVAAVNTAELDRPVLDVNTDGYGFGAVLPTVNRMFISPRYTVDEEARTDLEWMLARHFTTGDATTRPLVLLGHPGAGKSLLTKVLAARLSRAGHTVVRVPLRSVEANASIADQVDHALQAQTNGVVTWARLAAESTDELRVVLLDGLDELLQAGGHDRVDYLHKVAEFQRVEALVNQPVAVVVTSRTVVADRVTIPDECPVVMISDFDDDQVVDWIGRWNEANAVGPARPLPVEVARSQREIARQPLLLLMLALYFADPEVELRADLSTAELYRRLLRTYAEREVAKQDVAPRLRDREVAALLRRLAIAALGMFNRGKQSITEAELTADLAALDEDPATGDRVLGEFFFVHTAQETSAETRRSYEFLHLTFAEYLVANHVVDILTEVAATTFRRAGKPTPDDDLLFALLSHEPLSVQPPILAFAAERLVRHESLDDVCETLHLLLRDYTCRPPSRHFTTYLSVRRDHIKAAATYSANLVLLRISTTKEMRIDEVWPDDPTGSWNGCVRLWVAALDLLGGDSVLGHLDYDESAVTPARSLRGSVDSETLQIAAGRLLDSPYAGICALAGALAIGSSDHLTPAFDDVVHADPENLLTVLATIRPRYWPKPRGAMHAAADYSVPQLEFMVSRAWELLCTKAGKWPEGWARELASWALAQGMTVNPRVVAAAAFRHREVLELVEDSLRRQPVPAHLLALARRRHSPDAHADAALTLALDIVEGLLADFRPEAVIAP